MTRRWTRAGRVRMTALAVVLLVGLTLPGYVADASAVAPRTAPAASPTSESPAAEATPPNRIPFDDIRAWFNLLHRLKLDGWRIGNTFVDGLDPKFNVATLFIDITGIPPSAFAHDQVIDLRELRRTRPDLARQLGAPPWVERVWALSRISAPKQALTQLRKAVGKKRKPEGRFARNFLHSEPAVFQALKAAEERLRNQGLLKKDDSLMRRLLDIFSDRDFCSDCDPYIHKLLKEAGMLGQVGLHSAVAYGPARQDTTQSAVEELDEKLKEYAPMALEALATSTSAGPVLPPPRKDPGGTQAPDGGPTNQVGPSGQAMSIEELGELADRLVENGDLGGIDFSSMELRYLSESPSGDASDLEYAFRAGKPDAGRVGTVVDGLRNAKQASDAFFVWLALPPDRFWVNLNPDQPNRIMDPAFGRTDAGRVLLEADFRLKKVDSRLMNPNTALGKRYWKQLRPGPDGNYCTTYRIWIVPAKAKVRETEDSIYVLDAPLDVKMRPHEFASMQCNQPESTKQHNARVYRRLLLPKVKQAVNNAPEFAPLRRVYISRVVAEWYRQNLADVPSAYADIVDSGDIKRWRSTRSWRPQQTFQKFLKTFKSGKFDYRQKIRKGNVIEIRTYRTGGVDFSELFKQKLTADAFESAAPGLAETVAEGIERASVDPQTKSRWLGVAAEAEPAKPTADTPVAPDDFDDATALPEAPDDPWSRDVAPYLVPVMVLGGAGLIGWAIVRERRRNLTGGPR